MYRRSFPHIVKRETRFFDEFRVQNKFQDIVTEFEAEQVPVNVNHELIARFKKIQTLASVWRKDKSEM